MRRGGVSMRGACLRKTGGTKAISYESGSSSSNRLRTINGKIVRMRGKGDIRSFASYMRPLIKMDGAHIKGTYLGRNLLAVGMDANNKIIPLATGVSQGEMVETWSWFMTKLKEYISENFREVRPKAYRKLKDVGLEKWSRAYFPTNKYTYMTSNCVESKNALTKTVRKVPIMMLMDYYRDLIERWYFKCRYDGEDEPPTDELSQWAAAKVNQRLLKSVMWAVHGLPCGYVCAMSRCVGMTNCNKWAKAWFSKRTLKSTYQELVYPLPDQKMWETPHDLQEVLPHELVKPQPGRPKNKDKIRSQGNGAVFIGRKTQRSLGAVPAIPDISGDRQAYKGAAQ
ncbi:transposase, MuDR, MULE transposase domain protein [Tanacetum coccineum]